LHLVMIFLGAGQNSPPPSSCSCRYRILFSAFMAFVFDIDVEVGGLEGLKGLAISALVVKHRLG